MLKPQTFDVLVVYSDRFATSAINSDMSVLAPFTKESGCQDYNDVYAYLLNTCQENGVTAAFTTSADVVAAGTCSSYWTYSDQCWNQVEQVGQSDVVFSKILPTTTQLQQQCDLLLSDNTIQTMIKPHLVELFNDKQLTFDTLGDFSIPTVNIKSLTPTGVKTALRELKKNCINHPNRNDFTAGVIVKDRFGFGGDDIYMFAAPELGQILSTLKRSGKNEFIVQPFLKFDTGYLFEEKAVSADIRLVFIGGEVVQTYVRIARDGDFRCNEHQGASLNYIPLETVPFSVQELAADIAEQLDAGDSLFSLDFLVSNAGNPYLLEGNSSPGLDWNLSLKQNEQEAHKLIDKVVDRLSEMANTAN